MTVQVTMAQKAFVDLLATLPTPARVGHFGASHAKMIRDKLGVRQKTISAYLLALKAQGVVTQAGDGLWSLLVDPNEVEGVERRWIGRAAHPKLIRYAGWAGSPEW